MTMPYLIRQEGSKWVVRKKWTGKKIGTTDSRSKALAMIQAIHANERRK